MTQKLKDLHLHLYGCLTSEKLWELGRDRHQLLPERMQWFESEFLKATGTAVASKSFWDSARGFDLLKETYEATRPMPFAHFQAKFNLVIALFPVRPDDMTVLRTVMETHAAQGIHYCEYRTFLPPTLNDHECELYLTALFKELKRQNEALKPFHATIALTLQRDVIVLEKQMDFLAKWKEAYPDLAPDLIGIDFAGYEEASDVEHLLLKTQNKIKEHRSLQGTDIFLHVGETCEETLPDLVLKKIWDSANSNVKRLGHASVAGLSNLEPLTQKSFSLSRSDFTRFHTWILKVAPEIADQYPTIERPIAFHAERFKVLQEKTLQHLRQQNQMIESCPSSNLVLGHFKDASELPFHKFRASDVPFVICSDDPGIFATTLTQELKIAGTTHH